MDRLALLEFWQRREIAAEPRTLEGYSNLAQSFLELGEAMLACDVASEGTAKWPDAIGLHHLLARSLAIVGSRRAALELLEQLTAGGARDEETLGLLARVRKDEWDDAGRPCPSLELERAREAYLTAYRTTGGIWTGINAATLTRLAGRAAESRELARDVAQRCERQIAAAGADLWLAATLGEAALLLEDGDGAKRWYQRAATLGGGRLQDIVSVRKNARLILDHTGQDPGAILDVLAIPRVAVFSGHMVDRPGRQGPPRFPPERVEAVKLAIAERLRETRVGIAFASGACGGDILFLEAALEMGAQPHIVLPYTKDRFVIDSVDIPGTEWGRRFAGLHDAKAVTVTNVADWPLRWGSVAYEYANHVLLGMALLEARKLDTELVPIVVWDGKAGDGPGGTASMVELFRSHGLEPDVIPVGAGAPAAPVRVAPTKAAPGRRIAPAHPAAPPASELEFNAEIRGILMADIEHFSSVQEDEIPAFVAHYIGPIGLLADGVRHRPLTANSWGDAVYYVFATVRETGLFALELAELIARAEWRRFGLDRDLPLRIALHAGPLYFCMDPVARSTTYRGNHVNRAARLEPSTPPGQVYATQEFAALAAVEGVGEFVCEYSGKLKFAKGYGTRSAFRVRRR